MRTVVLAAVFLFGGFAPVLQAANWVVTRTDDTSDGRCDEDCSLREAIQAANENAGRDTVVLRALEYALGLPTAGDEDGNARGDLDVTDGLLLRGSRTAETTINAFGIDRVLEVLPGIQVELRDLVLQGGRNAERGGGIDNAGTLLLTRVRLRGNRVASGASAGLGGGIHNSGQLTLRRTQVVNNHVTNSSFELRVQGGGIHGAAGGVMQIDDSTVRGNTAIGSSDQGWGGGLVNHGSLVVQRSLFDGNISTEYQGSAILNFGTATLRNVTVSGNGHEEAGAAVGNARISDTLPAQLQLRHVTIADNSGGGLYNAGQVTMYNSVIGGNYRMDGFNRYYDLGRLNCYHSETGTVARQDGILVGNNGNCSGDIVVDNAAVMQLVLLPLAANGGPTLSHALRRGPYAIDAGVTATCLATDQRGVARPVDGDGDGSAICDIGAVEQD